MAALSQPDPRLLMKPVQPRSGFPVQNMGGLPRAGTVAPPKPFLTQPTVAAGPPGPIPGGPGVIKPVFANSPGLVLPAAGSKPLPRPPMPVEFPGRPAPRRPMPVELPGAMTQPADPNDPGAGGGGVPAAPPPAAPPVAPPAPAPAAAPPAAPTPTPAPPPGSSSSSGSSGQTGVLSPPAQGDLEQQIRDYISQGMSGSVSPQFIQRAKEQVFRNVGGQTKQATNRINEDAIRRGLYKSGIPAEGIANVEAAGQGAMASGVSDILNSAEAQNIQGRQAAAGTAGDLLGANRSWTQYQDQKAAADAARRAAGAAKTFDYVDPDTGQVYQMDESWF